MKMRMTAIIVCLAVASCPAPWASAQTPKVDNPAASTAQDPGHKAGRKPTRKTAAQKPAAQKPAGKKAPAAIAQAYATMPLDERLAIQSALAWTNYYDGPPGGDFDDARTIDAVKSFQKSGNGKETGSLSVDERARLADAAQRHEQEVGWRVIDDAQTGARFGLPEKLVSSVGASRTGSSWMSGHGQVRIETFRLREGGLEALFEQEKKTPRGRSADYSKLNPDSFVIAGTQGLKNFVVRVEARGAELRGVTVLYDQATGGIMEPVAIAVANSFQGFPDANAEPPGQQRSVEYSTAIAVDRSGDLVAAALPTAGCDYLAVPGHGHAVHVADDAADDLALIRLYGASDLAPAPLAGESEIDDLTLAGIADPQLQQGGSAVTKVTARLDGQRIEPTPPPGFAGAAAIDAQGRFAGMVALGAAAAAGTGPMDWQATLIRAATVYAFLAAHRIAPQSRGGPIERSVVRLICVRK
jgi:hypothetical protein